MCQMPVAGCQDHSKPYFKASEAHHVANGAELRHVIGPGVLLQVGSVPEPFAAEVTQVRLLPVGQQRLDAMR